MASTNRTLQHEIQQTRPFRSAAHEAVVGLLRTADVVRRYVTAAVEPAGVTHQQYNVLRILRGASPEGLPTLAIGERLIEETPGMTRLLDRLEAKGLVRRERCREDRRQVLCWITDQGITLLEGLEVAVDTAVHRSTEGLTQTEVNGLLDLMEKIRHPHCSTREPEATLEKSSSPVV